MKEPLVFSLADGGDDTFANRAEFQRQYEQDRQWDRFDEWYKAKQREVQSMFDGFNIDKDKNEEEKKAVPQVLTQEQKQRRRMRRLQAIKNVLRGMSKYGLKFGEKVADALPSQPFQHNLSKSFLKAIKEGKLRAVEDLLRQDRFLVHQYDVVRDRLLTLCR